MASTSKGDTATSEADFKWRLIGGVVWRYGEAQARDTDQERIRGDGVFVELLQHGMCVLRSVSSLQSTDHVPCYSPKGDYPCICSSV